MVHGTTSLKYRKGKFLADFDRYARVRLFCLIFPIDLRDNYDSPGYDDAPFIKHKYVTYETKIGSESLSVRTDRTAESFLLRTDTEL